MYCAAHGCHLTRCNEQIDRQSPAAASVLSSGDDTAVICNLFINIFVNAPHLTRPGSVQGCMRLTASMIISQIGTHDGDSVALMTDQVCLRRCMLNLQKLQLWCMGFASFHSSQMYLLQLPCSWLHLQPVKLPLAQLIVMADCLFPSRITCDLPPPSSSAAKISACYLGSAFERHVLLALLHPSITLPLDSVVHGPPPDEQSARAHQSTAAWCCSSVFMHTLHCMRLATRSFVLGFTSAGKPGHPDCTEFLKFIHELQVMITLPLWYESHSFLSGAPAAHSVAVVALQHAAARYIALCAPLPQASIRCRPGIKIRAGTAADCLALSRAASSARYFTRRNMEQSVFLFYAYVNARNCTPRPARTR